MIRPTFARSERTRQEVHQESLNEADLLMEAMEADWNAGHKPGDRVSDLFASHFVDVALCSTRREAADDIIRVAIHELIHVAER